MLRDKSLKILSGRGSEKQDLKILRSPGIYILQ